MNWPIQKDNLPEFHFDRQPKPSLRHQMLSCKLLNSCWWSFNQVISWQPKNSAEHWPNHTKCNFSRLAKALSYSNIISLPKTALLNHSREIQKMPFNLFIFVAAIGVLLFINKATICISSRFYPWFYCRTIAFSICVATLSAKMLQHVQVIYFVIKPSFQKWDLRFSRARESSAYLRLT